MLRIAMDCSSITDFQQSTAIRIAKKFRNLHIENHLKFPFWLFDYLPKLFKLGEIDGVKFLAWKSGGVKFLTNFMSDPT